MTGKRFGRLTVIREAGRKRKEVTWECICDCGNKLIVPGYSLRSGNTNSCGCYNRDRTSEANKTHGQFGTHIYHAYTNMKTRCYNPHYYLFQHYGGKGIAICDEWMGENGFMNFYEWSMKNGYKPSLSIDRIDNSKDYSPDNCRWVDMVTQQNNRTNNRMITANGETHTMAEWSKLSNIPYYTIQRRLKAGWNESDAVLKRGKVCASV